MNLGFKLAVVAGFATVLGFRGGTGDEPLAASSLAAAVPTPPPDPSPANARPADLQTRVARTPVDSPADATIGRPPEMPLSDGVLSAVAPETTRDEAAGSFAAEVLRLSSEADEVDRLWLVYKVRCGVRVGRQYPFGREWFSIFDRAAEQTITGPGCDEVHRRVRQHGEKVGRSIEKARTTAHQAFLDRATENGMLRWHALHWPQFDDEEAKPRRRDERRISSAPARSKNE
ncbi:MAG TPA: hypothetical protein VI669_02150 [Vicinamibacteria bacterium]